MRIYVVWSEEGYEEPQIFEDAESALIHLSTDPSHRVMYRDLGLLDYNSDKDK